LPVKTQQQLVKPGIPQNLFDRLLHVLLQLGKILTKMTKIKIGRNDPCHCGSGQKYKRCCQEKDERAERGPRAGRRRAAPPPPTHHDHGHAHCDFSAVTSMTTSMNSPPPPTPSSIWSTPANSMTAEQAARDLLVRFPEVHDGYDRLGMVYEARGENKQAADYYRKVIDFVRAHPDQYEPGSKTPSTG
jgi:hypothetical protein